MLKSFESTEIVSLDIARKIYDNWGKIKFANNDDMVTSIEKCKLREYINKGIVDGKKAKVNVTYHYSRNKIKKSRQMVYGVGLQNLKREIRHSIANEYYYDIDMVNSEPTLLLNYCIKAGYKHDAIEFYCVNREKCLHEMKEKCKLNRIDAKKVILSVVHGKKYTYKLKWFSNFSDEIDGVHKQIKENPAYAKQIEKIRETKDYNIIGTLLSEIFQEIENDCLMKCLEFLVSEDITIKHIVLMFDGFMIPKKDVNISDKLLEQMSEYVSKTTGYNVKYIQKDMDEGIDTMTFKIDDKSDFIDTPKLANNDFEASDILLEYLEGQCFYCNNQIWLRTQTERVYVCDEMQIMDEMINKCMMMGIRKIAKNGKHSDYSSNISHARNIVSCAINKIKTSSKYRDEEFVDRMITYSRDKIFFRNGYIIMGDEWKCVIEDDYDDYDITTPIRISYDIPIFDKINEETKTLLMDKVLLPIFGEKEVLNNYLQHIARAITGHIEDKDWVIMQGMRNSGKGVITSLNKNTFGVYSNETSANNFLMERQHTVEDPKKYAWLNQNRWTRLLHTSEVKFDASDKTIKVDGNLIKNKLASGGDVVEVRDLYQSAIRIKPQCRLFMMCNDIPPISPPDAVQTLTKFSFPSQFVEEEIYETKKKEKTLYKNTLKADLSIKDFVMRKDVCDCYLQMILNSYANKKVINCAKVRENTSELKMDFGDETSVVANHFKFTGSKKDSVLASDLIEFHRKSNMNVSICKLKDILRFNGAVDDKHLGDNKSQRGFICVKLIQNNEEEL